MLCSGLKVSVVVSVTRRRALLVTLSYTHTVYSLQFLPVGAASLYPCYYDYLPSARNSTLTWRRLSQTSTVFFRPILCCQTPYRDEGLMSPVTLSLRVTVTSWRSPLAARVGAITAPQACVCVASRRRVCYILLNKVALWD